MLRRALLLSLACFGGLALAPGRGNAQAITGCSLVQPADYYQIVNGRGETISYFRDPVRLACDGGVRIEADSAVINQTARTFELVGHALYRDSTRVLTASWANYLGPTAILFARGDVLLRNLEDGSTVTGQVLEYRRETSGRPEALTTITGRRPHAVLKPRTASQTGRIDAPDDPGAEPPPLREGRTGEPNRVPEAPGVPGRPPLAPDTAAPVQIWADRMEFVGEALFIAMGAVQIERADMTGSADTARYEQLQERMTLIGRAQVESDDHRLLGHTIDAFLADNELRTVFARGEAQLESAELRVQAPTLRIGFVEGEVDRMEAWDEEGAGDAGRPGAADRGAPAGASSPASPVASSPVEARRAVAHAQDFRLEADSIDARAEAGTLREVRAVGSGYGEREPDSLAAGLPDVIARDWIRGDTIIGYFATAGGAMQVAPDGDRPPRVRGGRDAPPDSSELVLERIMVAGGRAPAVSLYRMEPSGGSERGPVNLMQASRIVLFLAEGDVTRVEAEGPIEGLYLDPLTGQARAEPPARPGGRSP